VAPGIELNDVQVGALLATSAVLLCAVLCMALVALWCWLWLRRHRRLFVERDEDGATRFGGELYPRHEASSVIFTQTHFPIEDEK
jgi:uncharacterized iron-regulated membrane protein